MDLAREDNKAILADKDNGFSGDVTLHNLSSQSQVVPAFGIRVTQELDPETGIMINSRKSALNINLTEITIGNPIKGWRVDFTDYKGTPISGQIIRIDSDKTFGYASLIVGV